MKKVTWKYPVTSEKKAKEQLVKDIAIYPDLLNRHPKIIRKIHKDGSYWYHILVDDI